MKQYALTLTACTLSLLTIQAEESPWELKVELSTSSISGNTDSSSIAGKVDLVHTLGKNRQWFKALVLKNESNDDTTADKTDLKFAIEHDINTYLTAFIREDYILNEFSGYNSRSATSLGLGYDVVKEENHILRLDLAMGWNADDTIEDTALDEQYGSSKIGFRYDWTITETIAFHQTLEYSQALDGDEKAFSDSETHVNFSLTERFGFGLRYIVNHQSEPPTDDLDKTDITFLTSLIISL